MSGVLEEMVMLFARSPDSIATLLAEHVDDGRGKCRCCTLPQSGYLPWPCITYQAAVLAADVCAGRQTGVNR
jgi:hypothetical protein